MSVVQQAITLEVLIKLAQICMVYYMYILIYDIGGPLSLSLPAFIVHKSIRSKLLTLRPHKQRAASNCYDVILACARPIVYVECRPAMKTPGSQYNRAIIRDYVSILSLRGGGHHQIMLACVRVCVY